MTRPPSCSGCCSRQGYVVVGPLFAAVSGDFGLVSRCSSVLRWLPEAPLSNGSPPARLDVVRAPGHRDMVVDIDAHASNLTAKLDPSRHVHETGEGVESGDGARRPLCAEVSAPRRLWGLPGVGARPASVHLVRRNLVADVSLVRVGEGRPRDRDRLPALTPILGRLGQHADRLERGCSSLAHQSRGSYGRPSG
jgi:hypothetical protein